jgi:hypothetical protein
MASELEEQILAFTQTEEATFSFLPTLTSSDRAAVHRLARRYDLLTKSTGSELTNDRILTLHRRSDEDIEQRKRKRAKDASLDEEERHKKAADAQVTAWKTGGAQEQQQQDGEEEWTVEGEEEEWYDAYDDLKAAEARAKTFYTLLGVPRGEDGSVTGGESRLRAGYHRGLMRWNPSNGNWGGIENFYRAQKRFKHVVIAYAVLMDPERRSIYHRLGVEGLRSSEAYQEESVFDLDEWEQCEYFFSGTDPDDREYFLLNGNQQLSDEEGESEEDAEGDAECAEDDAGVGALATFAAARAAAPSAPALPAEVKEEEMPRAPAGLGMRAGRVPAGPSDPDPWRLVARKIKSTTATAAVLSALPALPVDAADVNAKEARMSAGKQADRRSANRRRGKRITVVIEDCE